jgi:F0F1-type ATP synthase gamma subunit
MGREGVQYILIIMGRGVIKFQNFQKIKIFKKVQNFQKSSKFQKCYNISKKISIKIKIEISKIKKNYKIFIKFQN